MSVVSLIGVNFVSNPAKFLDKFQLEITFECLEALSKGEGEIFLAVPLRSLELV
jgi:hypothetical protein